jgi:hypothetical protein
MNECLQSCNLQQHQLCHPANLVSDVAPWIPSL